MLDDVEGFERWYRRVHPRLLTAVVTVTGDVDVARDAVDEALARALEHWARVQEMKSPEAWTYTVALNVARRRFRRRSRERALLRSLRPDPTTPGPSGELWRVVADLSERQRTAVALRHVAQLTEPEIAEVMGVKRGTVSATLRAAYAKLRLSAASTDPLDPLPQVR